MSGNDDHWEEEPSAQAPVDAAAEGTDGETADGDAAAATGADGEQRSSGSQEQSDGAADTAVEGPDPLATNNSDTTPLEAFGKVGLVVKRFFQILARIAFAGVVMLVGHARDTDRDDPLRHWLLLAGNRWTIIWTMTLSFFAVVMFFGAIDVVGISQGGFVVEMFSTIIAGLFSFTPVVIGVNSLSMTGLSSSLGGIESRIESVEEFRDEVADLSPMTVVTPTDPAGFIDVATDALHNRIGELRDAAEGVEEPARTDVTTVADDIESAIADVEHAVDGNPDIIDVLIPMMNDDYSRDINRVRQLRRVYTDLPAEAHEELADIQRLLESLDVTRAYFKTMYLQQELAAFSRYIAYAGVNALLWSMFIIMVFANGTPDVQHGTEIVVLVSVGMTAAFFAFAVLFAYILRIATVIKRTSAPGAFTPQKEGNDAL